MLSGNASSYLWSAADDSSLRPAICVIQTSSGFRPATSADFGGGGGGGSTVTQVAISGSGGLIENVITFNGYNALPVIVVSGGGTALQPVSQGSPWSANVSQSGIWSVGLTGTNNVTITNPVNQVGITGQPLSVNSTQAGVWSVGLTGTNTVTVSNPITQVGITGQPISVTVSNPTTITATRPQAPVSQATYAFTLTGIGAFSNYLSSLPSATGNVISVSFETDSSNSDKVYYAFSGTATTGQAWELRGGRDFEVVSGLSDVYFAQLSSGQRIMAHYQTR